MPFDQLKDNIPEEANEVVLCFDDYYVQERESKIQLVEIQQLQSEIQQLEPIEQPSKSKN